MEINESRIALSIEKMNALRTMGIDTSDASMCWIKEPNEGDRHLVVHDEYCYEMLCLCPVSAYTLEDIMRKIKGTLAYNRLIKEKAGRDTPWTYTIQKNDHNCICNGIFSFGKTPLEAAYNAIVSMQKKHRQCIEEIN